jgi:hypothetical protein
VVALNNLAMLSFHRQETDPPKAKGLLEEARRVADEAGLKDALVEKKSATWQTSSLSQNYPSVGDERGS